VLSEQFPDALAEAFWGMKDPFRYFNSSLEVIRLVVTM